MAVQAAWTSIAERSKPGLLGYLVLFLVLLAASGQFQRAPRTGAAVLVPVAGLIALRAWLLLRFQPLYAQRPLLWKWLFCSSLLALAVLLTALLCLTIHRNGEGAPTFLALAAAVAVTSMGVLIYSHQLWLIRSFVLILTLPVAVTLFRMRPDFFAGYLLALSALAYVAYLMAFSKQLHEERWSTLEATELLRRSREDLRSAKEAAERANEAKSRFLAHISHEIRTPMAGVIGLSDLLLKAGLTSRQEEYARLIQRSAGSLLRLIDDILDFSKIEAGKLALENVPFDLRELLDDICGLMRFKAREQGIGLALNVEPDVPDWVLGDPARLRQVLINLIGNAVKFTPQGEVTVSVGPGPDGRVEIAVRDTGIGIPPEAHSRIFLLFSQADSSTSRRFGGTGLGLAISQRLVEEMGGSISLESEPGQGSTFRFSLRLERRPPPSGPPAPVQGAPAGSETARPWRVLVAEDDLVNQVVVLNQLAHFGYQAIAVSNGREALEALEREELDLVLMDCHMPELDGYGATREIRRREKESGRSVPVIGLTANALKENLELCREAGMNATITKPFDPETLRRILDTHLGGSAAGAAHAEGSPDPSREARLNLAHIGRLRELRMEDGSNFLTEMLARFRSVSYVEDMRGSLESRNLEELASRAHRLRGTSATLGAVRLPRLCTELELAARQGDAGLADRLAAVSAELDAFVAELAVEARD